MLMTLVLKMRPAAAPHLTYHLNTLGFLRRVLEQAGWRAAMDGAVASFSWWDERRYVLRTTAIHRVRAHAN